MLLIGIDPGIVDTGVVSLRLDMDAHTVRAHAQVWSDVTARQGAAIQVKEDFLQKLGLYCKFEQRSDEDRHVYIEGYRNRGKDIRQDQRMSTLVQEIRRAVPGSQVVDNTGVKNVVTDATLRLLSLYTWPRTNHADLRSAVRIALKGAISDPDQNKVVAAYLRASLEGNPWSRVSTVCALT